MRAYDYLVDYVLKNVWCSPRLDYQFKIEPKRITRTYGEINTINTNWRTIKLPTQGARYHVYQYGQIFPLLLGLKNSKESWKQISEACTEAKMLVDIYFKNGLMLPRTKAWYMVTKDNNLIMALEETSFAENLYATESVYFRFYTNAYFRSPRSYTDPQAVVVRGKRVEVAGDIINYQTEILAQRAKPGAVFCFINGVFKDDINPLNTVIGDEIEYVYDSSVKTTVSFRVGDLKEFESSLDSRRKYLLNYSRALNDDKVIDYRDDIDVYLRYRNPDFPNQYVGTYYSQNTSDWLRNVTHRDYSIPVQRIASFSNEHPEWSAPLDVEIVLFIRHGGFARPLIYENNRIHELYRLSDEKVSQALVGIDSTVENWQAAELEASLYALTMGSTTEISRLQSETLLGYNAVSKALADTPNRIYAKEGPMVADVPYGLQNESTGYEYDSAGKLIDFNYHVNTSLWPQRNADAVMVELVANYSYLSLDEYYGVQSVNLDPKYQYRCYTCPIIAGIPNNQWVDVTDSSQYVVVDGVLTWITDPSVTYTLVRTNKRNLSYKQTITPSSGNTRFALRQQSFRNNMTITHNMQIPMGELDLWANGHSLIEGVDYILHFPEVILIGQRWLAEPQNGPQEITVRFTNFCDSDLKHNTQADKGYIYHDTLSHNHRYDIRDDKVVRIVINGSTYDRSSLKFDENGGAVIVPSDLNGKPYCVRDVVVPTRQLTDQDPYVMKAQSELIDKKVSDYLSLHFPFPEDTTPNVAPDRYPVVSPFLNAIMHDLKSGIIDDPRIKQFYTDMDVREIVEPYLFYLQYDPTQPDYRLDPVFTVCVPHVYNYVVELSLYHYRFLERVNKLYCSNLVQLSNFFKLEAF